MESLYMIPDNMAGMLLLLRHDGVVGFVDEIDDKIIPSITLVTHIHIYPSPISFMLWISPCHLYYKGGYAQLEPTLQGPCRLGQGQIA